MSYKARTGPTFTPVNWALTGVAGALTVGRYAIRGYNSRRFYWDDLVHLFALVVLITHGATNQLSLNSKAAIAVAANAKPKAPPAELIGLYKHNLRLSTANNCFLYLVFWLVKLSFLLFYRLLFQSSAIFKKVWLAVLAFTLLTFWVPIAGVLATCAGADTVAAYKACQGQSHGRIVKLEYSCAVNIASDLAIMALPLWMLKGLKISTPQKIALGLIFSLAIVCVVLDIVRVIEAVSQQQALYTIIEINFVVIISCLPTYRALLGMKQRRQSRRPSGSFPWRSVDGAFGKGEDGDQSHLRSPYASDAQTEGMSINVTRELEVIKGERDYMHYDPMPIIGSPPLIQTKAFS